ncbi:MAG: beta-xylosidase, partial [Alphaproteobacteria bacterium]|nr:beta-xylosidase [Alphaproteobacteria bacterium]
EEFFRLYDVSADALLRAVPDAQIGGPDTTGPGSPKSAEFLKQFLEHCAYGKNYATGRTGSPLDVITFHPKGKVQWIAGHARMGMAEQLQAADAGFKIVASFPEWRHTPVILDENDPEPCAGCSPAKHPEDNYRNSPIYAVYSALDIKMATALAAERGVTLKGAVTWAFQFDDQPYFMALRDLATNGIDKPVLNGFRALGLLGDTRLTATSSAAISADAIEAHGVPRPVLDVTAARKPREVEVLLLHYRDDDVAGPAARVQLSLTGFPAQARQVHVETYRADTAHGDAYTAWLEMGSPQKPTPAQYLALEAAGKLPHIGAAQRADVRDGALRLVVNVPIEGLALVRIGW